MLKTSVKMIKSRIFRLELSANLLFSSLHAQLHIFAKNRSSTSTNNAENSQERVVVDKKRLGLVKRRPLRALQ